MKKSEWNAVHDHVRAQERFAKSVKERALEAERDREALERKPVSAVLISTNSKKRTGSAVGRAVIGDMLFGFVGAFIGASTASSKDTATFSVKYADGHKGVETVEINSKRFRELCAVMHD